MRLKLPVRIITLVCAASLLVYACGDSTSPVEGRPVSLTLIPSEFTLNAVGDTKDLTATVYDALGNVIDTTVQFEPSDPAIVTVTEAGKVTATGVGVALVTASLGSLKKTSEVNVFPVGTEVQKLSGDLQSAVVNTALPDPLVVQVSDPGNNPVPGIAVSFTVISGGGSLTVDSAITDASGRASTVLTLGTRTGPINRVAVLAGGVGSTQFVATGLADVPQDAQVLTGDGQIQPVGTTLPIDLAVLVRDQFGNGVPGQDVNYAVLTGGGLISPTALQTDSIGVARAQWTLGATLGTQTAAADVPVLSATPAFSAEGTDLTVAGITPDPLVEGQPARITGTGFETVISNVRVTVDGVAAQVTGVPSTTTIDILVPQTQCLPARDVPVTVTTTTGGTTPAEMKPLKPGAFVNMAVGEMALIQDPSDFCFQFEKDPMVRRYLLGVQSAAIAGSRLTFASVLGVVQGPGPAPSTVAPNVDFTASQGLVPAGLDERAERWRRHREAEAEARVADLELAESIMRSGIDFASAPARQRVDSTVAVGDTVSFNVPKLGGSCTDFTTVTATVKAVGLRGIWLKDNANVGPGFTDVDYQGLSDQLDNFVFDVDTSYFGEPTDLDDNARIVVLVTQQLNEDSPKTLGFVTSTDFFPVSACRRSNFAEVYYAKAPGPGYPRDIAFSDAPVLIAHEFTHIIQFGRRFIVNQQNEFLAAFLAEGQATLAEEVVGHVVLGNAPWQNLGFNVAFDGSNTDPNDWYFLPFFDISFYYGRGSSKVADAPHECSWLTGNPAPCGGRPLWYGVTWSLLRWVNDHFGPSFPGDEQAIQKALIDSDFRGLESIEDVIGVPIETFLAEWAATLYLDDRGVAGLPVRLDFPSWNLRDIYEGGNLPSSARLDPIRIVFTNFVRDVDVMAASTAYFLLTGDVQSPTALRVRDQADGRLPPNMQVFLVRMN